MNNTPHKIWRQVTPETAGFSPVRLARARNWLEENGSTQGYRCMVVRDGQVVCEWYKGIDPNQHLPIASAAKTIYANVLGVAIAEGRLPDADTKVVELYPEMMEVLPGTGPKEGRYAFEKDRGITFRQLISNTSGYMKPGEEPGKVFHYQTFGMNILTHALAKLYGYYDTANPDDSAGFGQLIKEKIAKPIGASWTTAHTNFDLHEKARLNIYGNYCQVYSHPLDLARLGWLWCNWGRWDGRQVIPEAWLRQSAEVAPAIKTNCPQEEWMYGFGTWTNAAGILAPDLPRELFTAAGAGGHYVSVYPSLALVVVQNPGPYSQGDHGNFAFQRLILEAIEV